MKYVDLFGFDEFPELPAGHDVPFPTKRQGNDFHPGLACTARKLSTLSACDDVAMAALVQPLAELENLPLSAPPCGFGIGVEDGQGFHGPTSHRSLRMAYFTKT